jgi:hypothetical protein
MSSRRSFSNFFHLQQSWLQEIAEACAAAGDRGATAGGRASKSFRMAAPLVSIGRPETFIWPNNMATGQP